MMRNCNKRHWLASLLVASVSCQVGCATLADKSAAPTAALADRLAWWKKDSQPAPYPNPAKMAVTWTPDTLVQTGRTPTRGFGGRLYFYDEHAHAVPVEGTLIIHAFHEGDGEKETVKRFEFTPDQFTNHFSQTDLGASYSIWVPWDAVGGEQDRVSLVASFRPVEGQPIQSVSATVVLPGHRSDAELAEYDTPLSPQYLKWRQANSASAPPRSGLTTTTIHRRPSAVADETAPEYQVRPEYQSRTMMARDGSTPALDIVPNTRPAAKPLSRSHQPTILPTSGWAPAR